MSLASNPPQQQSHPKFFIISQNKPPAHYSPRYGHCTLFSDIETNEVTKFTDHYIMPCGGFSDTSLHDERMKFASCHIPNANPHHAPHTLIFGGRSQTLLYNDLILHSNGEFRTLMEHNRDAPGRMEAVMVYVPSQHLCLVHGGRSNDRDECNELFVYDLRRCIEFLPKEGFDDAVRDELTQQKKFIINRDLDFAAASHVGAVAADGETVVLLDTNCSPWRMIRFQYSLEENKVVHLSRVNLHPSPLLDSLSDNGSEQPTNLRPNLPFNFPKKADTFCAAHMNYLLVAGGRDRSSTTQEKRDNALIVVNMLTGDVDRVQVLDEDRDSIHLFMVESAHCMALPQVQQRHRRSTRSPPKNDTSIVEELTSHSLPVLRFSLSGGRNILTGSLHDALPLQSFQIIRVTDNQIRLYFHRKEELRLLEEKRNAEEMFLSSLSTLNDVPESNRQAKERVNLELLQYFENKDKFLSFSLSRLYKQQKRTLDRLYFTQDDLPLASEEQTNRGLHMLQDHFSMHIPLDHRLLSSRRGNKGTTFSASKRMRNDDAEVKIAASKVTSVSFLPSVGQ